jgi:hypothetical protein
MKRREFIQCAVGAACFWPRLVQSRGEVLQVRLLPAATGDLAGEESECGFAQALGRLSPAISRRGGIVIVPSASALTGTALQFLPRVVRSGTTVLIDLADGFAATSDLRATRLALHRHFGIEVAQPVPCAAIDYVHYRWPLQAQVRHFSRISYIKTATGKAVAHLGFRAVVICKEAGLGRVVVFGSALGPLLLAGDREGHQILAGILSTHNVGDCADDDDRFERSI